MKTLKTKLELFSLLNLISTKILFAVLLCLPFALSAQWTDGGPYIKTNDNVTIGTNNNTFTFYARKNKSGWQGRFANRGGAGADIYLAHGGGYGMHIRGWTTDGKYTLQLHNANAQTNVFYNNGKVGLGLVGKVGVGTTNPTQKLHVTGNVLSTGQYITTNANSARYVHGNYGIIHRNDGSNYWILLTASGDQYGGWNTLRPFRINNVNGDVHIGDHQLNVINGNVGIGTATPDNKLDVNGTVRAKEIKVESGWSDYVFYDDYELSTLEEEEKYIQENGHLPGFESEEEMGGEIQLGDVSRRQQAKIEEMMLHLIDMKKEITQLKKENEELKKRL